MKLIKILSYLLLPTAYLLLVPKPVFAQTTTLSVWPPLLEVTIKPGKSAVYIYNLTNYSDRELAISPQLYRFVPNGNRGNLKTIGEILTDKTISDGNSPVLSFDSGEKLTETFRLKLGETKQLVLKITTSANTPQKDFYYVLYFATAPQAVSNQSQASSITKIGTNILITVTDSGQPPVEGKIKGFSVQNRLIDSFSPVNFTLELANLGTAFFKPFGAITITGILQQKDTIKLLEQNVLATSSRLLDLASYRPKLALGPFTVKVSFTLNATGPTYDQVFTFWYFPYKITFAFLVLAFCYSIARRFIKIPIDRRKAKELK